LLIPPLKDTILLAAESRNRRKKVSDTKYISICFSQNDRELIAWVNMLRAEKQSVSAWVQALLLAEDVGVDIDAGAVYVPEINPAVRLNIKPIPAKSVMFGDDTEPKQTKPAIKFGWQIRGEAGEITAGSILSIRVTRPVIIALIDALKQTHKRLGPYIKAVIRKKIRTLDRGPNIAPDESQIRDIFALYESRYVSPVSRRTVQTPTQTARRLEAAQINSRRQDTPSGEFAPEENDLHQSKCGPKRLNKKDAIIQDQPAAKEPFKMKNPLLG